MSERPQRVGVALAGHHRGKTRGAPPKAKLADRPRSRGSEASVSLDAATKAGRRTRPSSATERPRLGLSRNDVLDLVLAAAERDGASPAYARVLRGAADVFGSTPVSAVSIEMILDASRVSRRTFYQFFEGKEAVLDALLAVIASMWIASAQKAVEATPTERALVQAHADAFRLGGYLLRTLVAEALAAARAPVATRFDALVTALAEIHASLQPKASREALRARTVAVIAILLDRGIDPDSEMRETSEVVDQALAIFAV